MAPRTHRGRFLAAAAVAALLFPACGGGDVSVLSTSTSAAGQSTTPAGQSATTAATSGTGLFCEDPPAIEIALGTPIQLETNTDSPTLCFWIEIPVGLDSIAIDLSGLTGDLVLAAGYGFVRSVQYHTGEFWDSREEGTAPEAIVIADPAAGPYFITVHPDGFGDESPFQLLVTSTPAMTLPATGATPTDGSSCAPPATELALGATADGEVKARATAPHPRDYFCVEVPAGVGTLTIGLTGLTGNLELLISRTTVNEVWGDRTRGGTAREVVIEAPAAGVYNIEVAGAHQGAESAYTLSISG